MKSILVLLLSLTFTSALAEENSDKKNGVDVDHIECSWNKSAAEAKEKCKPDPAKPSMGQRLDTQLKKDAKTLKNFLGIEGKSKDAETSK